MQCPATDRREVGNAKTTPQGSGWQRGAPSAACPPRPAPPGALAEGPALVTSPTGPSAPAAHYTSATSVTWRSPGEMQGAGLRPLECPCPRFPPVRPFPVSPVEINGEMWLCPFECGFGPREPGPRSWLRLSPGVMRWAPEHKSPGEKGHGLSPDATPLFGAVRPRRLLQGSQGPRSRPGVCFYTNCLCLLVARGRSSGV